LSLGANLRIQLLPQHTANFDLLVEAYDATSRIREGTWDEQSRQLEKQQLSRPRIAYTNFKELSAVPAWHLDDKAQTWQTLCTGLHIRAVKAEANP